LREGTYFCIDEQIFGSSKSKIVETKGFAISTVLKILAIYGSSVSDESSAGQNKSKPTYEECDVYAFETDQ